MKVISTNHFLNNVKYYFVKKKYKKINEDIQPVVEELEAGNLVGDRLDNLNLPEGTAAYKVRIANSSVNVGKSNGFRIIYYVVIGNKAYLVTIYSKKDDVRTPTDQQLELLIRNLAQEII